MRNRVQPVIGALFDLAVLHSILLMSMGANRKGGSLAVTDVNLIFGRLIPRYFPNIFGKSENEALDTEASKGAFEKLAEETDKAQSEKALSLDEIVSG